MKRLLVLGLLIISCGPVPLLAATSGEYFNAGKSLYQQGHLDQAAKYFEAATQTDPNNWQAYQSLGNCRYQLKQLPEALVAFNKSLALHPDNPQLKSFADNLRAQVGSAAAPGLPDAGQPNLNQPADQQLLSSFNEAKTQEEKSREGLRQYGQSHPLTEDESYIAQWGEPKGDFRDNHFTFVFGILTPTVGNIDIGFFINPTTNVGAGLFYVPISTYNGAVYNGSTNSYSYSYSSGDWVYFEPRIKFYSAPSGLTTYHGFSFIYYGIHEGKDLDGYYNTNFDILGLGYQFGFRTLPMDGMTMELGWKLGVAVLSTTNSSFGVYNSSTGSYVYNPQTTTIPFPYIIPEFRFGFTF